VVCFFKNEKIYISVERDKMHLLSSASLGYYEVEDDNRVQCDLETFSFIVNEMVADNYKLVSLEETKDFIEVSLSNEELSFRLHYTNDGNFVSICKVYEKSYVPLTYINEKLYRGENINE
jgi:hypothetical protein